MITLNLTATTAEERVLKEYLSCKNPIVTKNYRVFVLSVSEKPAPVKGEKVSLKIQRADLIEKKLSFESAYFSLYDCNTFSFSLDGFGFF